MSPLECGAACLAMILSYHGRKTSVSECRDDCGAGRDGATALAIAEGGRRMGLRVKGYSVALADFARIALPAIVHWKFNHFIVVEGWSPARIENGLAGDVGKVFIERVTDIASMSRSGSRVVISECCHPDGAFGDAVR